MSTTISARDGDWEALDHPRWMREALHEAALALAEGERPIGAVVVHAGQVVARGRAQHRARRSKVAHAELNALLQGEQYIRVHAHQGCVLYTTVEPCVMCLGATVVSDVDYVVYALADRWMHPGQMLQIDYVRKHIRGYLGGVLEEESILLWQRWSPEELAMLRGEGGSPVTWR